LYALLFLKLNEKQTEETTRMVVKEIFFSSFAGIRVRIGIKSRKTLVIN